MTDRIRKRTAALLGVLFILSGMLTLVFPDSAGWLTPGWLPIRRELFIGIALAEILGGGGLLYPRTRPIAGVSLSIAIFAAWCATAYIAVAHEPVISDSKPPVAQSLSTQWEMAIHTNWEDLRTLPRVEFPPDSPQTLRVRIKKLTKERVPWHIQLIRNGVSIIKGEPYELSFRARAAGARPMNVSVGRAHGDYGSLGLYREVDLTEEWQLFTFAFIPMDGDMNARIYFDLGQNSQDVELESVVLRKVEPGDASLLSILWQLNIHGSWEDSASSPRLEFPPDSPQIMRVRIKKLTKERVPWQIQLIRIGVSIIKGEPYQLSFRARAAGARSMYAAVGRAYGDYGSLGLYQEVALTKEWQPFTFAFTPNDGDANARIFFDLGQDARWVEISDVALLSQTDRANHASETAQSPAPMANSDPSVYQATAGDSLARQISVDSRRVRMHLWWKPVWIILLVWSAGIFPTSPVLSRRVSHGFSWQSTIWIVGLSAGWAAAFPWASERNLGDASFVFLTGALIGTVALKGLFHPIGGAMNYRAVPMEMVRAMQRKLDANGIFWGAFVFFVLLCEIWLVSRNPRSSPTELLFIAVNRLLTYTVLIGLLVLFLQAARSVTPKIVLHTYTVLLGMLPIISVVDYLITDKTGKPLLTWVSTLLVMKSLKVKDLLMWANLSIAHVAALFLGATIIAVVLMRVTAPLSRRLFQEFTTGRMVVVIILCLILSMTSEFLAPSVLKRPIWRQMRQTSYLWFLSSEAAGDDGSLIAARLAPKPTPQEIDKLLDEAVPLANKPDIFFVVLETLRLDAVTPEVAPRLYAFKSQCQSADRTFSGSYGSDVSWFSFLHSLHSFRWPQVAEGPRSGAYPLRLLKRLGYRIEVRLASDSRWKGLGNMLFGDNDYLADYYIDSSTSMGSSPLYSRDRMLMNDLFRVTSSPRRGGSIYIHEIASTHWNYSWPSDFPALVRDYAPVVDFTKLSYTPDEVRLVKNRYLNSVHWVDHLFGELIDHLKHTGQFDNSIVVVLGDHGEEFYENGLWAHGSKLSRQQTQVPICVKLPNGMTVSQTRHFMGHVDVMPTIFWALGIDPKFYDFLDGISMDRPRETLLVSSIPEGPEEPNLVLLHPEMKVQLSFWRRGGQTAPDRVRVLDYVDYMDRSIVPKKREGQTDVEFLKENFPKLIDRLFMSFEPVASDHDGR
jgi:uncharacterized membrane protein